MGALKKHIKYAIWIILFYIFTRILIFIGLNIQYKTIQNDMYLPEEITISKAEATAVNGRIYGEIKNLENEDINRQYIKVNIYNEDYELAGTKYIQSEGIGTNYPTKFEVRFKSKNIKYYDIEIVEEKDENTEKLFDGIFISEDVKVSIIVLVLIYLFFFG